MITLTSSSRRALACAALSACTLLLGGCSTPYRPPQFVEPNPSFPGLIDLAARADGLSQAYRDRGVTFATTSARGLCVSFVEPVTILDPTGTLRHPAATITVADVEGLAAALHHPV